MKYYILLLLLLTTVAGFAQDYSVIPAEPKTYFANASGYLRGIRIDSVQTGNGITTYYPFHTARTTYLDWSTIADTTGGSWQGKYILEDTLGSIRIPTQTGDTVRIKRHASLNDPWTFYADTAATYYTATVTAIDTATFAGIFDTVKTIELLAFNNGVMDTSDVINGLEIKLSKNNGWVQALDFYLFPYRPLTPNDYRYDCYFTQASTDANQINKEDLTFRKVDFTYLKYKDVYDFQVGDVFLTYAQSSSFYGDGIYTTVRDSIITKNETDSFYLYGSIFKSTVTTAPQNAPPSTLSDAGLRTLTEARTSVVYGDTTKMPEESGVGFYYYYFPDDSSYCYRSYKFGMLGDKIINNKFGGGGPEPYFSYTFLKAGLGIVEKSLPRVYIDGFAGSYNLLWARKGASPCDAVNQTVAIKEISKETAPDIKIYPNPSSISLHIDLPYDADCTITLYTVTGIKAFRKQLKGRQLEINISGLAPGNYFLKYADKDNTVVRKVSIRH